ncbi:MAG: phosphoribosylformylglycinamidine synthase subunit PurQ, partial [Sinobacteraceae bacterium]|nr:phosphoribosylformylglycinamidine synthase subunit PurQ [Nevskiaceae bacterium]
MGRCVAAIARAQGDCEILVVDDHSSDETAAVAAAQGARVIVADCNAGCSAARNLGAANARGELLFFVDADVVVAADALARSQQQKLLALRYVDNRGEPTERYPANPNGSPLGVTGFTTEDGRATIMMPHPERVFR